MKNQCKENWTCEKMLNKKVPKEAAESTFWHL